MLVSQSPARLSSCLRTLLSPQALDSLRVLVVNRNTWSDVSSTQASILLSVIQQLWQQQDIKESTRLTAFRQAFLLLAKWAHAFRLTTAVTVVDKQHRQEASANALKLLSSDWCTAQACAACVLFLGAASQGKYTCVTCPAITKSLR